MLETQLSDAEVADLKKRIDGRQRLAQDRAKQVHGPADHSTVSILMRVLSTVLCK